MALLPGSPAVMAGNNTLIPAGITTDQRGAPRIKDKIVDLGAFASGPDELVVTTLTDSANPAGPIMSLRDAINYVNSVEPVDVDSIIFAAGLQGTISLVLPLPSIVANVGIDFRGTGTLTLDGHAIAGSSILSIAYGSNVDLFGLTLSNGSATTGGAISNAGTLGMLDCTISGNTATNGGGIFNIGTASLAGCTLSGNSASGYGGAVLERERVDEPDQLHGQRQYGRCFRRSRLGRHEHVDRLHRQCKHRHWTFRYWRHLYPRRRDIPQLDRRRQFRASGPSDIGGRGTAAGTHNLIGTGIFSGVNNLLGFTNPQLGPLMFNGGPTETMMPAASSPAIAAGDKSLLPPTLITDQRGAPRISGGNVDTGAVERQPQATIVVTTLADEDNGTIDPTVGQRHVAARGDRLRRRRPGRRRHDLVRARPAGRTIDLSLGALPAITAAMTIDGPGANVLLLDGQDRGSCI